MKIKLQLAKDLVQSSKEKEMSGRKAGNLCSGKGAEARNGGENMEREDS